MPELPEVEVTRLSFADRIAGARIVSGVFMGKPLRWPLGCASTDWSAARVVGVRRRGKYLLLELDARAAAGASGHVGQPELYPPIATPVCTTILSCTPAAASCGCTTRAALALWCMPKTARDAMARKLLGHLGVEPLAEDFDLKVFQRA
jgi:formamidopyrimidine-DNA glycosylase